jgi:hypothetical protein
MVMPCWDILHNSPYSLLFFWLKSCHKKYFVS